MLREALVLAVVVGSISGQTCFLANQFEVKAETITLDHGLIKTEMFIAADWKRGMLSIRSNTVAHSYPYNIRVLQDFANNVTYTEDLKTQECVKQTGRVPIMQQYYQDAEKVESLYIGRQGHGINATVYRIVYAGIRFADYSLSDDCVPLSLVMVNRHDESPLLSASRFLDYTDGIRDPSVFKIPPNCKPIPQDSTGHHLNLLLFGTSY